MAVEIPVVIDIDSAFKNAANRLPKAIKPLQDYMDTNALQIRLDIGDAKKISVKQILDDATLSAKQLNIALQDVESKISKAAAAGGYDLSRELKYSEKIILQAYSALEAKINGTTDASKVMGKIFSINIERAQDEVAKLGVKIDELTRKQNRYYALSKKNAPGAKLNYANVSAQIKKAEADLIAAKKHLGTLTVELDKIATGGKVAAASISAMKTPAMQIAEAWRRGSAYLAKYNQSLATANSRLGMLLKGSLSLIALHSATTFVRNIREVTSEFEMQRVALGGIIQDTEYAEKLFGKIKAAAIQSPFEIKDLVSFTKQLSAYRIETENLFDVTMRLADISAGLGVDMSRLVLAYGQVRAASVLRGQELRQFTEAGIPLVELLAEKFEKLGREGTTTADVFELISKRAVPFSMIEDIFNDMTNAGGIFYKMQEKQSETLKGQWMKLKDALSIMYDEIGNTKVVHGAMETLLKDAMNLLKNWEQLGKNIGVVIAALSAYKIAVINARIAHNALTASEVAEISALEMNVVGRSKLISSLFGETTATKIQVAASNLYVKAKSREMMATNMFTKALWKMVAAMLANPYAAAIAGITAIVAVLVRLVKKSKEAAISNEELQKSLANYDKVKGHAKDIEDLCDAYDELSKKTSRTKTEQERLERVTKDLAKAYPSAISGANEHTSAIKLDTAAIRERNEAVKEAIRLSLQEDYTRGESQRQELLQQYNRLSEILARGTIQKGAYGGTWYEPITEEQRKTFGAELLEIEKKLSDLGETLNSTGAALADFQDEFEGPAIPEFFGDAWRMNLSGYSTMLNNAKKATKAFSADEIRNFGSVKEAIEEAAKAYETQSELVNFYSSALETASKEEQGQLSANLNDAKRLQELYGKILTDYNAWGLINKKTSGRDDHLQRLRNEISDITNAYKKFIELLRYEDRNKALSDIGILFPSLSGWEPTFENMISKLEGMLRNYRGDADATRILEQAIANIKFDDIKDNLDDKLKKLSDDIKRSETARNFYNDMLGLTGDEQLSASLTMSVYGQTGKEFKDRVQKEMFGALESVKDMIGEDFYNELIGDITIFDVQHIREQLEKLPEAIQPTFERLLSENEKYNADWLKDFQKTYGKAMDYQERIDTLNRQRQQKKIEAAGQGKSESDMAAIDAYYDRKIAEVEVEALKNTDEWIKSFEDLNKVGTSTLKSLVKLIRDVVEKSGADMEPEALRTLMRNLEQVEEQIYQRNPFKAMADGMKSYADALRGAARARKALRQEEDPETRKKLVETENQQSEALDKMQSAVDGLSSAFNNLSSLVSSVGELINFEELSDGEAVLSGLTDGIQMLGVALAAISAILTVMAADPVVLGITAAIAAVASIGKIIGNLKVAKLNREIKHQEDLLEDLTDSYDRLEKAMAKSFGSDYIYNYNKQLENLAAQQAAYEEQARLEREKGKKADEEKIKDYEKSARSTAEQIADMSSQLSEYFSGTDLTSAARDFASSWIEAYKEFGSTTDAMKEKFQDLIENMVTQSLGAKIIQTILRPLFDEIDSMAATEGELSALEIAQIANMAPKYIEDINSAMTGLMNQLGAAGYNMRQRAGQFTGIARNIAGASEESINGLAAGINTQNFYISMISQNVAAILAAMTGETVAGVEGAAVTDPYRDQMLAYVGTLPQMRDDMYAIRSLLERVIKPNGTAATHYVATRM